VQLDEDSVPMFLVENGKRRLLLWDEEGFRLKGGESWFSREQLLLRLAESPADFSPNVLLRPLYQDLLLPTCGYVGGPAEIAYFAQVAALYRWRGLPMPAVIPRASFTVMERKVQRILEKTGLDFLDLFSGFEACLKRVVEESLGAGSTRLLEQLEQQFSEMLDNLEPALHAVDPTLVDALKNSRAKILHQVSSLRNRLVSAHVRQNEVLTRQLSRAFNLLYPAKNYQERHTNSFYFLSRYGRDFIMSLRECVDLESGDHQLFSI
jgi:bacillithiol biosynthesis cysteine-adding enzyme BshC